MSTLVTELNDFQAKLDTNAQSLMGENTFDGDTLTKVKEEGFLVLDQLDRVVDDEIIDDVSSLRTKLEGFFPEKETNTFVVMSWLIRMSDTIENIKVYFEDED